MDAAAIGKWTWFLLCALLPISGAWVSIPLVATVVFAVIVGIRRKPVVPWPAILPLACYYALHVIGMAWTTDVDFGLFDLQIKAGLIVLPFCAFTLTSSHPSLLRHSMVAFTTGMLLSLMLGLAKAWQCYAHQGLLNCFSQSTLSFEVHPSYAAWYGCWILAYWGYELVEGRIKERGFTLALFVALALILVFTTMLASKSGIIGLVLVLLVLGVAAFRHVHGRRRSLVLAVGALAIAIAALFQGRLIKDRMEATWIVVQRTLDGESPDLASSDGNALRMVAWWCSMERLSTEPFGAGTGDIKHALTACYDAKGAEEASKRNLNAHGQWMQSAVALGWPGVLSFGALLLGGAIAAWRRRSHHLAVFMLLFLVNSLVESVLEVQAGVLFFALFVGLLLCERTSQELGTEQSVSQ